MELEGGGQEGGGHSLVESQSQPDQRRAAPLEGGAEALAAQVQPQDGGVNGAQGLGAGKRQGEDGEVALEEDRREFGSGRKVRGAVDGEEEELPLSRGQRRVPAKVGLGQRKLLPVFMVTFHGAFDKMTDRK